jgi:hypothetical protein
LLRLIMGRSCPPAAIEISSAALYSPDIPKLKPFRPNLGRY